MLRRFQQVLVLILGVLVGLTSAYASKNVPTPQGKGFKKKWNKTKFSHRLFGSVLKKYVKFNKAKGISRFDYAGLRKDKKSLSKLNKYIYRLSKTSWKEQPGRARKFSFLINAYNAITIRAVLNLGPKSRGQLKKWSVLRNVKGFWKKFRYELGGKWMTLNDIENGTMRPRFKDARLHFALVCAAIGCPALFNHSYSSSSKSLNKQLNRVARWFLRSARGCRIDRAKKTVTVSSLFNWYKADFTNGKFAGKKFAHELLYIAQYLPKADASYLKKNYKSLKVKYSNYNWTLNQR